MKLSALHYAAQSKVNKALVQHCGLLLAQHSRAATRILSKPTKCVCVDCQRARFTMNNIRASVCLKAA